MKERIGAKEQKHFYFSDITANVLSSEYVVSFAGCQTGSGLQCKVYMISKLKRRQSC